MTEAPSATGERKLVTVLFCDLVGSTALAERLDPEAVRTIQGAYFDRMRFAVEQYGGTVEKFIGDAVVAVFGVPYVHEDDAERAVRCALAMREALESLNDSLSPKLGVELLLRIGIDTGEAVTATSTDQAIATGDVTNTAARVEQSAKPGEVLVGRETFLLTERAIDYKERPPVLAKGKARPVAVWAARGVSEGRRRPRSPLMGRDRELEALALTLDEAIASGEPRVVVVLGEPGIGKSRLAEEFAAGTEGRARVLRGAAPPYGEGAAWRPVADVVRAEAGILEGDPPEVALPRLAEQLAERHPPEESRLIEAQIGPLLGSTRAFGTSGPEILWALGRYLEGLARAGPVVVLLDDLHWADRILLETIQELAKTIRSGPVVVVALGRPELRERLGGLGERSQVLALQPLPERDAMALVSHLEMAIGRDWSEDQEREIVRRAEGNPLFLEEIGAIFADVRSFERPGTLHALIAARIDLLPSAAKRVAQAGAVIGDVFWDGAVAAALDGDHLAEAIRTLRTRGFVDEEEETAFLGHRQLRFHHNLIREVAYESLPKSECSRVHRKVADWLEPRTLDRPDLSVGIAHHLDRALTLGAEVAVFEQPDPVLPDATANAYLRAAEWTSSNAALPEAAAMLRRAAEVAASSEVAALCRARLAYTLALAGEADEAIREADAVATGKAPTEATALASLARAQAAYDRGLEGIGEQAKSALRLAREGSLRQVEARALELLAWHEFWTTETTPEGFRSMERLLREAAEAALESGDLGLGARVTGLRSALLATVPMEIGAAEALAQEGMRLARSSGSPRAMAMPQLGMAFVRMHQDRLEEAAEFGREMLRLSLECGEKVNALAACAFVIGRPLRLLGRHEESLEILEQGLALSREVGGAQYEPNVRMERALTMLAMNRPDDADRELVSLRLDDYSDWMTWTSALAEVRAAQGRVKEAEGLWREVLDNPWGALTNDAVEAALGLGRFLARRGRRAEARALLDQARSWLEGRPAPLLERQIREVEATLAEA